MAFLSFSDNLIQNAYIIFQNSADNFEIANKTCYIWDALLITCIYKIGQWASDNNNFFEVVALVSKSSLVDQPEGKNIYEVNVDVSHVAYLQLKGYLRWNLSMLNKWIKLLYFDLCF